MMSDEYFPRGQLVARFALSFGGLKSFSMVLLIVSEYMFLTWPICLNEPPLIACLYPYAAFVGTILLAITYISFMSGTPSCDLGLWIIVELISSGLLTVVMVWVINITIRSCERPSKWTSYVPESIGLFVAGLLFAHAWFWFFKLHSKSHAVHKEFNA